MNRLKEIFYRNEKFYINILKILMIFLTIYVFIMYILELISPFAFGYVIYLILRPIVNKLDKKFKVNRGVISIFSIFIFLFLVVGIISYLGKAVYEQAELFLMSKYYTDKIWDFLNSTIFNIKLFFTAYTQQFSENILNTIINSIYSATDTFVEYAKAVSFQIVKGLPKVIAIAIISVISAFFFLKDEEKITKYYNILFPDGFRVSINKIKNSTGLVAVGYVKAQIILSSITFLIAITGLSLLDNKYAVLLATLVAFFDMLPFFGAGFILWPTAVMTFINGSTTTAILTFVLYGVIFLTRQMLEPRTLGKQISLHPLFTLLGIFVGVKIFGVGGLIVGPLTVVLVKALITED